MALWQWWLPATSTVQWFPPKRCGPGDRSAVPQGARNHTGAGRVSKGMEHQTGEWGRCTNKNKLGAENFNHGSWGFFIGCDIFHPKCGIWICIKMAEFTIILCRLNMGKTRFLTLNHEMEWSIIRSRISNRNRVLGHMGWVISGTRVPSLLDLSIGRRQVSYWVWGTVRVQQWGSTKTTKWREKTNRHTTFILPAHWAPVPAFPMTQWLCTDPFPQRGWHSRGETPKLRRTAATDGGTILKGFAVYLVSGTFGFCFFSPQNGNSM